MFDFIGDIHGHAEALKKLLEKLGYACTNGVYSHPQRRVFFTGDFIDRGPAIRETLHIARSMIDSGNAIAIMGNHEQNAICFNIRSGDDYLRKHSEKNLKQHEETIKQFKDHQQEYLEYINWFKKLPLYYECDSFRAVHACWDKDHIAFIANEISRHNYIDDNGMLTEEFFRKASEKGALLYDAVEDTLKGKEIKLPEGMQFSDKDGHKRQEMRVRWWLNPANTSFKDYGMMPHLDLPETPVDLTMLKNRGYYCETDKPAFFGHYWLNGQPELFRDNVCCLDYSVAKGGKLVAYRFDGEKKLSRDRLIFV